MKHLNRLWSRRRSWSSPGLSWPPETRKLRKNLREEKHVPWAWGVGQVHFVPSCTMLEQRSARKSQEQPRSPKCHGRSEEKSSFHFGWGWPVTWTELWERSTIIPSRFISFIRVWKVSISLGRILYNTPFQFCSVSTNDDKQWVERINTEHLDGTQIFFSQSNLTSMRRRT